MLSLFSKDGRRNYTEIIDENGDGGGGKRPLLFQDDIALSIRITLASPASEG